MSRILLQLKKKSFPLWYVVAFQFVVQTLKQDWTGTCGTMLGTLQYCVMPRREMEALNIMFKVVEIIFTKVKNGPHEPLRTVKK